MKLLNDFPEIKKYLGQGENPGFFNEVHRFDNSLDEIFGIKYIKDLDDKRDDLYPSIEKEALLTSYLDYHQILEKIPKGQSFVDLGAGYCRASFLCEYYNYEINCISVELSEQRAQLAKNKFDNKVIIQDILDHKFKIPFAENYFIYLPWGLLSEKILKNIFEANRRCSLFIIESHGDFIPSLNLYKKYLRRDESFSLKTSVPRHDQNIYKYDFIPSKDFDSIGKIYKEKDFLLWFLKFKDLFSTVLISSVVGSGQERYEWEGDLKGAYITSYKEGLSLYLPEKNRYLDFSFDKIIRFA